MHSQRGYTLAELMVAFTVLAILTFISLEFAFQGRDSALVQAEVDNIQTLFYAMEAYKEFSGAMPDGTNICSACSYNPSSATTNTRWDTVATALVTDGYLATAPFDDEWGNPYAYDNNFRFATNNTWSGLCSVGPNGTLESDASPANAAQAVSVGDDICVFFPDGD